MRNGQMVRKTYGLEQSGDGYDYLFKSKYKKDKEKLDLKQKQSTLDLTRLKNEKEKAQTESEKHNAIAAKARAETAQIQAAKALEQMKGAKAMTGLTYLAYGFGAFLMIGAVVGVVLMVKQGKKSALIAAKIAKARAAAAA